ncbi:16S rRNA (uracil(1498)-N(3))-methyltransferase, partial [Escherichia coli]|uniref:16S rRNA (uracil(1498)-N(3))-methyltransferase n=1 Tax=Escherichia coli TaxID=562 RepID=UPI0039DFEA78
LGVAVIQPVLTRRTIVARVNGERLAANAREAAEQCDRLAVPEVREAVTLDRLLDRWPAGRRLMFCDESRS